LYLYANYLAMSKTTRTSGIRDYTVQRTISLPFSLVEDINDEAELSGKTFSGAIQMLIRLGVRQREQFRINEEIMQKEMIDREVQKAKEGKS